ncbi:L10-interacting MYB domain-containing protein-like isoform X1 [Vitis riparia]|uniref:L10-interacting MYB domain-containing protein-like isoform X1 n=1 Tax=Vitis riparia TaxID=96939 RepID=UPI00155AAF00|nr:L10-interacting MYB domain-containing protein-like isoform X1 [Vitis riparia]
MAQHVEITRANWSDPTQRKHFIDLCLHEANSGFRSGGTLKPSSWPRIIKELEKLVGKRFNQKQLKNAWDYMKKQYLTWSRLITMMGDGYNSVTKTFDLPTERWEEYLQKYPEAKQFRYRPLANAEELEALFGGVLAIGAKNGSSEGMDNTSSTHSTSMPCEIPISLEEDDNLQRKLHWEQTADDEVRVPHRKRKRKLDQIEAKVNSITYAWENLEGPSVQECMKILRQLFTFENPLYFVAANAFCKKKEYRELWMDMESDQERIGWIWSLRK